MEMTVYVGGFLMRFNQINRLTIAAVLGVSLIVGCGKLEEKDNVVDLMSLAGNEGCLNNLGQKFRDYIDGQADSSQWEEMFHCATDRVSMFKKYVRGEHANGYTQKDVRALISRFLVTDKEITDTLINVLFEFKSSLFGGASDVITKDEIEKILNLTEVLKVETLKLNPYLHAKRKSATQESFLELSDAMAVLFEKVASSLNTSSNQPLKIETFKALMKEVERLYEWKPGDEFIELAGRAKVIIVGGSDQAIEGQYWPDMIRALGSYGGPLYAYVERTKLSNETPNEDGEYQLAVFKKLRKAVDKTLARREGVIRYELIDQLIEKIPSRYLKMDNGMVLKPEVLKKTARTTIQKMLQSKSAVGLDANALNVAQSLLEFGTRAETHIEQIYKHLRPYVSPQEFDDEARIYSSSLSAAEAQEVMRLRKIAQEYMGLFPEGSNEIRFVPSMGHSKNNLVRLSWLNHVSSHVLDVYAPGSGQKGKIEDLTRLIEDYRPILENIAIFNPYTQNIAVKRFRDANLFTFASNGDEFMDLKESTYYFADLFSSSAMTSRWVKKLFELCPKTGKLDELGLETMSAQCFREQFFGNYKTLWDGFPAFVSSYDRMSDSQRKDLQRSMEISARRLGYSDLPVSEFDISSFAGIPHYVEALVYRFDGNDDEILNKNEILDKAFPVFKKSLADISGKKDTKMLQAILTYLIRFGKTPPSKIEFNSILDTAHFLAWYVLGRDIWQVSADRGALYKIIAVLSESTSPGANTSSAASIATADLMWAHPEMNATPAY